MSYLTSAEPLRQPILIFCNSSLVQGRLSILRAVIRISSLNCMLRAKLGAASYGAFEFTLRRPFQCLGQKSKAGVGVFFTPRMNDATAISANERSSGGFVKAVLPSSVDCRASRTTKIGIKAFMNIPVASSKPRKWNAP
jgi:hypothetical protein